MAKTAEFKVQEHTDKHGNRTVRLVIHDNEIVVSSTHKGIYTELFDQCKQLIEDFP